MVLALVQASTVHVPHLFVLEYRVSLSLSRQARSAEAGMYQRYLVSTEWVKGTKRSCTSRSVGELGWGFRRFRRSSLN